MESAYLGPFHAHRDVCEQCRTRPFDLCREGSRALTGRDTRLYLPIMPLTDGADGVVFDLMRAMFRGARGY